MSTVWKHLDPTTPEGETPEKSTKMVYTGDGQTSAGAVLEAPAGVVRRRRRSPDMCSVRIPLRSRKYPDLYAIVDEADADFVRQWTWHPIARRVGTSSQHICAVRADYSDGRNDRRTVYMHRAILGVTSSDLHVDHINHDALDNRRVNLRVTTPQQNSWNQRATIGSSAFKGVCWHKDTGKWYAQIRHMNKRQYLGVYESEIDAAKAYDEAARALYGEFAVVNFPEGE